MEYKRSDSSMEHSIYLSNVRQLLRVSVTLRLAGWSANNL